jgi:hypothetical protein
MLFLNGDSLSGLLTLSRPNKTPLIQLELSLELMEQRMLCMDRTAMDHRTGRTVSFSKVRLSLD